MEPLTERRGLSANALKLIAILAMTADHIAWAVFPGYPRQALPLLLHLLGRITCPIMCYFIAEGFHYTRNVKKYMLRLLLLAFVSHFAYIYASGAYQGLRSFLPFRGGNVLNQTSVVWSLLGGLVMLQVCAEEKLSQLQKMALVILVCILTLPSDWSCIAALCVLSIGSNRGDGKRQILWCMFYVCLYCAVYFFCIDRVYGVLQLGVALSIPLLACYNGSRGRSARRNRFMKWLFYFYYPAHLFVIGYLLHH